MKIDNRAALPRSPRIVALIGAAASLAGAPGCAAGEGAAAPALVRVATFNTHNLFDDVPDGTEEVADSASYASHVAAVCAVLDELAADVVVLQEVENERVLAALAAGVARAGPYPVRILLPGNDPRGIHVAALSRFTPARVASHRDDPLPSPSGEGSYRYSRDCLELGFDLANRSIVLFGVHFKSKAYPDDPDKRLAEARHTRALADAVAALEPAAGTLVLGDFNDTEGSAAVDAIVAPPGEPMYDDLASRSSPPVWSHTYEGKRELLDHMAVNPVMASFVLPGSETILHDGAVARASDHAPVAATFRVGD